MTLRVTDLDVPFGAQPGLSRVSLDVGAGERMVIIGASGAGKTSLLRALAGLQPVTAGAIAIAGRDVTALAAEHRDTVYLHQTPVLFPHLTVFENVAFPLRVRRIDAAAVRDRVHAALVAVQLDALAARLPRTLSGGQAHRVALARAVIARPALLLLDEPLSSLDPALRDDVRRTILSLHAEWGGALLIVTHDLDDASALADRVAVLLDRRIAQVSPLGDLLAHPASLAVARLLAHANEIPGKVHAGGGFESPFGVVATDASFTGPAIAIVRPATIRPDARGVPARVVAVHQRAGGAIAIVETSGLRAEMVVDAIAPPRVGDMLRVAIDRRGVTLFQNVDTSSVLTSSTRIVS